MAQDIDPKYQPGDKHFVLESMQQTLKALEGRDPLAMASLSDAKLNTEIPLDERREFVIKKLKEAISVVNNEQLESPVFHSRVDVAGIIQSSLEADIIPQLQAFSEGNPVVWIPAGIKGILEHFNGKYPFQMATAASRIEIPNKCKIALLGDWGADNDHAKNVARQAMTREPNYMIHLGDIYYSGSEGECETFLKNWPLKDEDGKPKRGSSFALNGNHEMYSLGKPYFSLVLPALGQEASYFTLFNEFWQFQGLDTAYVPFSISGGNADARLQSQWNWLVESITNNPEKRNILLSHNQPVSAHLPEIQPAQILMGEALKLLSETSLGAIYGWFFGHEHRCAIYRDDVQSCYFRSRLIGNGAIGHHPQTEVVPAHDETGAECTPFTWVNKRSLEDKGVVAISSFAFLTMDGDRIDVEYIDEDGYVGYKETWFANDKIGIGTTKV